MKQRVLSLIRTPVWSVSSAVRTDPWSLDTPRVMAQRWVQHLHVSECISACVCVSMCDSCVRRSVSSLILRETVMQMQTSRTRTTGVWLTHAHMHCTASTSTTIYLHCDSFRLQIVGSLQRISSRKRKRQRITRQDTTESEDDGGRSHRTHRWSLRLSPHRTHNRTILEVHDIKQLYLDDIAGIYVLIILVWNDLHL